MSKIDPWGWRRLDEARANYTFDPDYVDTPYLGDAIAGRAGCGETIEGC
jgi:hypothetical protein